MTTRHPGRKRRLISRTDLARMAQVSQTAITKACKGKLAPAVVGDRINLDHEVVQAYLAAHGRSDAAPPSPAKRAPARASAPTSPAKQTAAKAPDPTAPTPEAVSSYRREKDELELTNLRERAREKQLRNDESEGRLISKDAVRAHMFGALVTLNKRLLEDGPRTVTSRLFAAARAGATLEEGEAIYLEIIGGHLEAVKSSAIETLTRDDD